MSTFYLTTPIYYVNGTPHLGSAYTTIAADAMARYRRLRGDTVFFLTGTDEHGDKIAQAAAGAGVAPQEYTDRISAEFRETWRRLGISNDDFIRTTEDRHKKVVQQILDKRWNAGEIYLGGTVASIASARAVLTDQEIVDGKCPDHLTPLTWIEEENYFFKMSKYQAWLIDYIQQRPDFIRPERYRNEILGFLRDPLQDLSISRPRARLEWGIPLPFDDKYVTYVWFDALINYVSALGGPVRKFRPTADPRPPDRPRTSQAPRALLAGHLKAAGLDCATPPRAWLLTSTPKMLVAGHVVEPVAFVAPRRILQDAFPVLVLREMTFASTHFSAKAFANRSGPTRQRLATSSAGARPR